jgi:hypothetical protein
MTRSSDKGAGKSAKTKSKQIESTAKVSDEMLSDNQKSEKRKAIAKRSKRGLRKECKVIKKGVKD